MPTVIKSAQRERERLPAVFFEIFPQRLLCELRELCTSGVAIDEIRIRRDRFVCVSASDKNITLSSVICANELDLMVDFICDTSLYAHADTIREGYVTLDGGIRVGIVGRASVSEGKIIGVYDISGLCFRVPHKILRVGEPVCEILRAQGGGVLVYSPPGQGKTTLLRAVSAAMCTGKEALRVCVIDSRGELGCALDGADMSVDVLVGYPRPLGIEIAARSMNAQLIVCDEIGTPEEADAILAAQNCGVPLLASAHASSFEGLLRRTAIARLYEARVFCAYVGICRREGMRDYEYDVRCV